MAEIPSASEALGKELARFVRTLRRRSRGRGPEAEPAVETMTPDVFRAVVAQKLHALEREMSETRTRINGLLFVVLGAVVTQVVMKVI